jgi:phytoene dehydrogenase-like protein
LNSTDQALSALVRGNDRGMNYDIAIIGGGHNGLVCAAYLAAAGLDVVVLERRELVGGAAVTEEFHPGYRNSTASYTVSLLQPRIIRELNLERHGLRVVERPFSNFLPLPDGRHFRTSATLAGTRAEVARFSARDAERLESYYAMLERPVGLLREWLLRTPPNVHGGIRDAMTALRLAGGLMRTPLEAQRDMLDLFTKSAGQILDDYFESEPIKALLGFDAIVGNFASPYTPGTAYVLLHHVFGEIHGKSGAWGHAIGGMGAITQAMLAECLARGVTVRTQASVARIIVEAQQVRGVRLDDGEEIRARRVVANVNPKLLFEQLTDPADLDAEFLARMRRYRCGSATFRLNVALAELPRFRGIDANLASEALKSGIVIAPSLAYMERAYFDARTSGWAERPIIEMLVPSTVDSTLAPPGRHVASLFCQHFAPQLSGNATWDEHKSAAVETILDTVDELAPNFKASVLGLKALSPLDLERTFGLVGGDIFHGALSLDQLFSARPLLGFADYRTPIRRLYLCGSGAHPGGGVTGAPGHNAAHEILRDVRRRR